MDKVLNIPQVTAAMDKTGLNQAMLADKLAVSRQAVSRWFQQKALPKPDKLLKLSLLLGLPFRDLVIKNEPDAPVVAFRKMRNRKTTEAHLEKARDMGRLLAQLVPFLPFDKLAQPAILKQPSAEYAYLQSVAQKVRSDIHVGAAERLDFRHLIRHFRDLQAVLIPVLWGAKERHENATHIYLPASMTTWVYLNLDVHIHDFMFWMAHELGHVLAPQLRDEAAEDFADAFAGALLFPEIVAGKVYGEVHGKHQAIQINGLKEWAQAWVLSPYCVYRQVNLYAKARGLPPLELEPAIHGATTNFNKQLPPLSTVVFDDKAPTPGAYVKLAADAFESPFFEVLGEYLRQTGKGTGFVQTVLDAGLLDAKGICAELT